MSDHRPITGASLPRSQSGSVLVLLTVAMLAMIAIAGLVLDGGHVMLNKSRLQSAVDAAALSGAKVLSQVIGGSGAASTARTAALQTLILNANAVGNEELADAIDGDAGSFAIVEFSNSVYGPFSYPGPLDARYVRVTVNQYELEGFFWAFLQSIGDDPLGEKQVAARAVAGPSPTAPCDITPIMVCGDPDGYAPSAGMFWGYRFGDLEVLKTAANDSSPVGPGNFQLIRLDGSSGAADVREGLAGGIEQCNRVGNDVETEPGNKIGPSIQGINARLAVYSGPIGPGDYPPDLVVDYSQSGGKTMLYDDSVTPERVTFANSTVTADSAGNLSTEAGASLYDYNDWLQDSAACVAGQSGNCQAGGVFERRVLKIVVGQCSGTDAGQTSVPVLGFACFYLLQPAVQKGNEGQIFGQFVEECNADGYPGPTPTDDAGPNIIQLYKTYMNGVGSPSPDS